MTVVFELPCDTECSRGRDAACWHTLDSVDHVECWALEVVSEAGGEDRLLLACTFLFVTCSAKSFYGNCML